MLFVIKKFGFWYRIKINFSYFCICISLAEARYGLCGRVQYFIEKRLLTLFLDTQKLRNFLISVKNVATVDALWCVYAYCLYQVINDYVSLATFDIVVCYIHIGVRLLRCSFNRDGQCEGL